MQCDWYQYDLSRGVHIRADFLYRNFIKNNARLCRLLVIFVFLFSRTFLYLYMTTIFVIESMQRGEKGMDTAWMPLSLANKILLVDWYCFFTNTRCI